MAGYIEFDLEIDEEATIDEILDRMVAAFPGWVARESHLEYATLTEHGRLANETKLVAVNVAAETFRTFGTKLIGLTVIDGAPAGCLVTFTAIDNAGYTIPLGTLVGSRAAGDTLYLFETTQEAVIPAGQNNVANVPISSVEVGTLFNNIAAGSVFELIDSLAFVQSVISTTATSGGVDAESDNAYLDRLSDDITLFSSRPVKPDEFALFARRTEGVHRAVGIDGYDPGLNERQTVTVNATGGTFTLTFAGQTTAAIAYNATAADVQAALEALGNINPGDVIVSGGPLATAAVTVEFAGQYASTNVAQMTADGALLTGTGANVAIATSREGVAESFNNERMVAVAAVDSVGQAVSQAVKDLLKTDLEARRPLNFVAHVINPTYTTIDVVFTAVATENADLAAVEAAAEQAVADYLDPAKWAGGADEPPRWELETIVRYLEVAEVINRVPGIAHIRTTAGQFDLTVNGGRVDVALNGEAPLPRKVEAGGSTVAGTVVA